MFTHPSGLLGSICVIFSNAASAPFNAHQIDDQELASIARYVEWTKHPEDRGGWGLFQIGPVPEGMVTWFLAIVALLLVARAIGKRLER